MGVSDDFARLQRARRTVSWASELSWSKDGEHHTAFGFQATYQINKDHNDQWQLWITRGGATVNAGWRESTLRAAKAAALDEEKDFARKAIQ